MKVSEMFADLGWKDSQSKGLVGAIARIESLVTQAVVTEHKLADIYDELTNMLKIYEHGRHALLETRWREEGFGCCTKCNNIVPLNDLKMVFVEQTHEQRGDYSSGDIFTVECRELHRACVACFSEFMDRHGWRNGKQFFYAFRVEDLDGRIMICKFGKWEDLPRDAKIMKRTTYINDEWQALWRIPPRISHFGDNIEIGNVRIDLRRVDVDSE